MRFAVPIAFLVSGLLSGCGFQVAVGSQPPPSDGDVPGDVDPADAMVAQDGPLTTSDAPCADDDSDGVCNDVDTWPCGVQPQAPGSPITYDEIYMGDHLTVSLSGTALNNGARLLTVAPNATFVVSASYSFVDCICTGCIDQIQVGLIPGTTKQCLYDANPTCNTPTTGSGMVTLTAPAQPGVYQVRFRHGQDNDCDGDNNTHLGWWTNQPPAAAQTVAVVCVQ